MIIIQKNIHFIKAGCLRYKMLYNNAIFENVFFYFCPLPGPLFDGFNGRSKIALNSRDL